MAARATKIKNAAKRLRDGDNLKPALAAGVAIIDKAGFALDYLEARNADTLAPVRSIKDGPIRLLVAAKIGSTRLIDNVAV